MCNSQKGDHFTWGHANEMKIKVIRKKTKRKPAVTTRVEGANGSKLYYINHMAMTWARSKTMKMMRPSQNKKSKQETKYNKADR